MGILLGVTLPAFMRCEHCLATTMQRCEEIQRAQGCHACGRKRCWETNERCRFYGRPREAHADATMGDVVPHMREIDMKCYADDFQIEGQQSVNWWDDHNTVFFEIDGLQLHMGHASGTGCNCLIDTMRQQLKVDCDVEAVRAYVGDVLFGTFVFVRKRR